MKKLFSLILVFALAFALSVNAFASCNFSKSAFLDFPFINQNTDSKLIEFGKLQTTTLTDVQKDFMRDFLANVTNITNAAPYYTSFIYFDATNQLVELYFMVSPSRLWGVYNFYNKVSYHAIYAPSGSQYIKFTCAYDGDTFVADSDEITVMSAKGIFGICQINYNGDTYGSSHYTNPAKYSCNSAICGNYNLTASFSSASTLYTSGSRSWAQYNPKFFYSTFGSGYNAAFIDDDGLLEDSGDIGDIGDTGETGGDSSESSGGSDGGGGTSEDTDNKGSITLPNIENNAAVPYDLNAWNVVLDSTMPTLRKVFSIGFPLFLIFLGVQIMLGLIRKFALSWLGGGRHGGGGNIKHD